MNAVNSAQGPEVEDDDLAAQVLEVKRFVNTEPASAAVQVGSEDALALLR
jgi:hypothetical protein